MAQVPNYYYNSPWIADAARNLASALKPPDPQELLARDRARWQFGREQQLAGIQDEERIKDQGAETALAELMMTEDVVDPVTGQVDEVATGKKRREIASRALAGGREFFDPTTKGLGIYSPTFETDQFLTALKAQIQGDAIAQRGQITLDNSMRVQDRYDARQRALFAQQLTRDQYRETARFKLAYARNLANLEAIKLRAQSSHGNGKAVSGRLLEDLMFLLDEKITNSGATINDAAYDELLTRMAISASGTGNVPLAVQEVWGATGLPEGTGTTEEEPGMFASALRRWGITRGPKVLSPKFDQPRPAQPTPGASNGVGVDIQVPTYPGADLSSAFTAPNIPTQTAPPEDQGPPAPEPKTPPPKTPSNKTTQTSGGPPAKLLKEGVVSKIKNPRTKQFEYWTLEGGKPKRMPSPGQ